MSSLIECQVRILSSDSVTEKTADPFHFTSRIQFCTTWTTKFCSSSIPPRNPGSFSQIIVFIFVMRSKALFGSLFTVVATGGLLATAQADPTGTVFMQSHIGAFRLFNGKGTFHYDFDGTILMRDYKGKIRTSGNVRKEYDSHGRIAFFGKGSVDFTGTFDSFECFGKNMNGKWTGSGGFRLFGDYDKDLRTGWYWFDNDPTRHEWPTSGGDIILPHYIYHAPTPVLRGKGG